MSRILLQATTAWAAVGLLFAPIAQAGVLTGPYNEPALTAATTTTSAGAKNATNPNTQGVLSLQQKIGLLRQKVKYVFVLFQENRSFDAYFGTYPGANGLFSTYAGANPADPYAQAGVNTGSFNQVILDTNLAPMPISPFLLPRTIQNVNSQTAKIWPEDTYSVDHSHGGYINDFHVDAATKSMPKNDGYALDNEGYYYATDASGLSAPIYSRSTGAPPTTNPTLQAKQKGEMALSHIDCDTIPFLWSYADRFTLFDNFHQTATGPSTPNAIAMVAAQVGDTQWVQTGAVGYGSGSPSLSVPNLTDNGPFPGSSTDKSPQPPPYGPDEAMNPNSILNGNFGAFSYPPNTNLTFASLPLSFMGENAQTITAQDPNPTADLAHIQNDILTVAMQDLAVNWGWYQQGYGPEPFDGQVISENGGSLNFGGNPAPEHASYIVHHNGPQYFGYVGDNPVVQAHLHGLQQFYADVVNRALGGGGVFWVRGGYYNNDGMKPADPNPNVQASTPGNDDHPNYSDAGISETEIADSINAIAHSPYWKDSAIIITYDETDGLYDHQPEQFRTFSPDGEPETGGPRIPTIVISPYATAHTISHVYSEQSSVIRFINELFGLTPLGDLPDEAAARTAGAGNPAFNAPNGSPQTNLGPADDPAALTNYPAGMGDMLEAFDDQKLLGNVPTLPPAYAEIRPDKLYTLPHLAHPGGKDGTIYGCQVLHILPSDRLTYLQGTETDPPPQDFNPRPVQSPGEPYLNINNNTAPDPAQASTGPWDPQ